MKQPEYLSTRHSVSLLYAYQVHVGGFSVELDRRGAEPGTDLADGGFAAGKHGVVEHPPAVLGYRTPEQTRLPAGSGLPGLKSEACAGPKRLDQNSTSSAKPSVSMLPKFQSSTYLSPQAAWSQPATPWSPPSTQAVRSSSTSAGDNSTAVVRNRK